MHRDERATKADEHPEPAPDADGIARVTSRDPRVDGRVAVALDREESRALRLRVRRARARRIGSCARVARRARVAGYVDERGALCVRRSLCERVRERSGERGRGSRLGGRRREGRRRRGRRRRRERAHVGRQGRAEPRDGGRSAPPARRGSDARARHPRAARSPRRTLQEGRGSAPREGPRAQVARAPPPARRRLRRLEPRAPFEYAAPMRLGCLSLMLAASVGAAACDDASKTTDAGAASTASATSSAGTSATTTAPAGPPADDLDVAALQKQLKCAADGGSGPCAVLAKLTPCKPWSASSPSGDARWVGRASVVEKGKSTDSFVLVRARRVGTSEKWPWPALPVAHRVSRSSRSSTRA